MEKLNCTCTFLMMLFIIPNLQAENSIHQKLIIPDYKNCFNCPIIKRNCQGKKIFTNGDSYFGSFRYGKPHGKGIYTWKNGEVYEGEFEFGAEHGFGKKTYTDGGIYEGDWVRGWKEGKGNYSFPCGDEFYGDFKDDKITGEGTILFYSGGSYSGYWHNNSANGHGVFSRSDGSQFVGNSTNGKKDGEGMVVWETGDTLFAYWSNGNLEDKALFKFNNGAMLTSFWEEGISKDDVVYVTEEGKDYIGTEKELAKQVVTQNFHLMNSIESNLQLAWYQFAIEHKANKNYDLSIGYFALAKTMEPEGAELDILEKINFELAAIKTEQNQSGVASTAKQ